MSRGGSTVYGVLWDYQKLGLDNTRRNTRNPFVNPSSSGTFLLLGLQDPVEHAQALLKISYHRFLVTS